MADSPHAIRIVTSSKIPVRNIWLLQLFASQLYQRGDTEISGFEAMPENLPDAVAQLLAYEVEQRLRQSLTVGFRRRRDVLPRVRGRIDIFDTYRHRHLDRARVSCRFDESMVDTLGNRLVRAALIRATRVVGSQDLIQRVRTLDDRLRALGVGAIPPPAAAIPSLLAQRNVARDRRMLSAAELLLALLIPAPSSGSRTFADITDGEHLRHLFEKAVYGFFKHRLAPAGWSVRHARQLGWHPDAVSDGMPSLLPSMVTDIELSDTSRHIVLDTKFTAITRVNQYGQHRLQSEHIYQMFAYLMSQRQRRAAAERPVSEGVLLHPVVDGRVDEEFTVQGHRIRFCTVDLAAASDVVVEQLLSAIQETRL